MNTCRPATSLLVAILLSFLAPGLTAQTIDLRHAWTPGESHRYRIAETMDQTISGPLHVELHWERTIEYTDRISPAPGDAVRVERTFDRVAIEVTRDSEPPATYDTADPKQGDPSHPLIEPFLGLEGGKVSFEITPEGRVSNVRGAAGVLQAMLGPLAHGSLSGASWSSPGQPDTQKAVARQLEQALRVLPGRPVRQGDRWPIEIDHASPFAGALTSDLTGTLRGMDPKTDAARIELDGALKLTPPGPDEAPSLAGLVGITLESGKVVGSILFDESEGRIIASRTSLDTAWQVGPALVDGQEPMAQTIRQTAELETLP